jgi:transposase, IS5 family
VSRTAERQVSFADWELMRQGLRLEPLLQAISDFLENQTDMIEQVRSDLMRGLKKAETGRSGLTPQQVLRSLVLMRIKNWNYRELRERIADGCTLRVFRPRDRRGQQLRYRAFRRQARQSHGGRGPSAKSERTS